MYFHYCRCWVMFLSYHHQRWINWTNFVNLEHSTEILITSLDNMEDILVFNQMVSCLCLEKFKSYKTICHYWHLSCLLYIARMVWKLKGSSRTWHLKFEKDNFLQFNKNLYTVICIRYQNASLLLRYSFHGLQ